MKTIITLVILFLSINIWAQNQGSPGLTIRTSGCDTSNVIKADSSKPQGCTGVKTITLQLFTAGFVGKLIIEGRLNVMQWHWCGLSMGSESHIATIYDTLTFDTTTYTTAFNGAYQILTNDMEQWRYRTFSVTSGQLFIYRRGKN